MSLLVHTALAAAIFFSYKTVSAYIQEQQHPCACCSTTINLNQIQTSKPPVKVKQPVKKIETKIEKPRKDIEKKEAVRKKPEPKKVVPVQEPLQAETVVQKDSNETQSVYNKVEKDVDTLCETKVIVKEEPKKRYDDYLSLHVEEIVALLKENLYYPRRARKQGTEGVVTVKFTLSKEAEISNIEVVKSDYDILARAARETIENLEGKLPKPDEELTLTIPINYDLK